MDGAGVKGRTLRTRPAPPCNARHTERRRRRRRHSPTVLHSGWDCGLLSFLFLLLQTSIPISLKNLLCTPWLWPWRARVALAAPAAAPPAHGKARRTIRTIVSNDLFGAQVRRAEVLICRRGLPALAYYTPSFWIPSPARRGSFVYLFRLPWLFFLFPDAHDQHRPPPINTSHAFIRTAWYPGRRRARARSARARGRPPRGRPGGAA